MAAAPGSRVFLASWLDKKMEWRFVYEHRYFILDGTRLSYRLEEHGAEKRFGTITSFEPWRESSKDDTEKGFCFTVWLLEGGSWCLRAATREIHDSWFRAIITVLLPSTNPSAAPSESGGGLHSRASSSIPEAAVHPHESEAISRSQTPARKGAPGYHHGGGGGTPGREGEADTSGLTAAAVAAATPTSSHRPSSPAMAHDAVLLSSMVEKEKAWRGQWRPRYMELREGRLLIIRSSATSTSERQRYVVEAVDPSPLTAQATWMLISTSTGDRFWVRFGSAEERQRWLDVCGRLLLTECSWHWSPLAENDAGRSWRLRQATSGVYDDLRIHYHCTAVVPSFREETWCPSLFIFGGSDRWCKPLFNPQARAFLPHTDAAHMSGRLAALELAGPHMVRPLQPAPYKEGPHALVRPLPRYGATLTCLPVAGTTGGTDPSPSAAPELLGARVVLLGGCTGGGYQPPATELWQVWRSRAACAPGMEMRWGRQDLPSYELPHLAFHDAVYVGWGDNGSGGGGAPATKPTQPHDGFLLVTGGLDVDYRCRAECYAVVWTYDQLASNGGGGAAAAVDAEERACLAMPTAYAFGQLPSPRAFHRMAVLEDGTVVLVGGRGVENMSVAQSVLTLAPEAWRHAAASWAPTEPHKPKPHAVHVDVAVDPASQRSENMCSVSSDDDVQNSGQENNDDDMEASSSQWLRVHVDDTPAARNSSGSTAQQLVKALPSEVSDVAVTATGSGGRVVVMGQVTQPQHDVKLFLLDFEPVLTGQRKISAGEQFPAGTRRVRCREVLLFIGAVPNRVVGITLHVFNGYLYVIGGCTVDKSKTDSYDLSGPLRVLLE